jgi:hypothetical protein
MFFIEYEMSETYIGKIKSDSGIFFDVKWSEKTGKVFISIGTWKEIGTADTPSKAMLLADKWLAKFQE